MPNVRCAITVQQAVTSYKGGLSLSEIGRKFNCHGVTVSNRLREVGVGARSISDALKGREITWAAKIGAAHKGRVLTEVQKLAIAESQRGRSSPLKGKRKATHPRDITSGVAGERHWNWKGGVSTENARFRQSSAYKAWRDAVFRRDNWTCCDCHRRGGYVEADHIKPFSLFPQLRVTLDNGRTLCRNCHKVRTKELRNGGARD